MIGNLIKAALIAAVLALIVHGPDSFILYFCSYAAIERFSSARKYGIEQLGLLLVELQNSSVILEHDEIPVAVQQSQAVDDLLYCDSRSRNISRVAGGLRLSSPRRIRLMPSSARAGQSSGSAVKALR